jgi:hypothetical protein
MGVSVNTLCQGREQVHGITPDVVIGDEVAPLMHYLRLDDNMKKKYRGIWSSGNANQYDWLDVLLCLKETILASDDLIDSMVSKNSGREKVL